MKAKTFMLVIMGLAGLVLVAPCMMVLWPPGCPVTMQLERVEPSLMVDDGEKEPLLVTLSISNLDTVAVMFENGTNFLAKVAGHWEEVSQSFGFQVVHSKRKHEHMFLVPGGTEACRFRLHYQTEMWKSRLMATLGSKGRSVVAKVPWLYKRICPNQYATMPVPPRFRQIELDVSVKSVHE